jgi:hypothetical protein
LSVAALALPLATPAAQERAAVVVQAAPQKTVDSVDEGSGILAKLKAFQDKVTARKAVVPAKPPLSNFERTKRALTAVSGVAAVGLIIALVVLMTAQGPLEAVARAAERDISASFWVGVLWQFLAAPILIVLTIALIITVVGIFIWPIVALAWALAYAGALTLGLYSTSLVLGRAFLGRNRSVHERSALLTSLTLGLLVLIMVWLMAGLLVAIPKFGVLMRFVALALTWAAATVGLGAVVRSRAGTRREHTEPTTESAIPVWQTPTPVFGVVAARRPTPANSSTVD